VMDIFMSRPSSEIPASKSAAHPRTPSVAADKVAPVSYAPEVISGWAAGAVSS
jgi:hypothetical protein